MSPEVAVVVSVGLISAVAAFGLWLRFKTGETAPLVASLMSRIERLEMTERNRPQAAQTLQMPSRMSVK